jgi:hypothetical protein
MLIFYNYVLVVIVFIVMRSKMCLIAIAAWNSNSSWQFKLKIIGSNILVTRITPISYVHNNWQLRLIYYFRVCVHDSEIRHFNLHVWYTKISLVLIYGWPLLQAINLNDVVINICVYCQNNWFSSKAQLKIMIVTAGMQYDRNTSDIHKQLLA